MLIGAGVARIDRLRRFPTPFRQGRWTVDVTRFSLFVGWTSMIFGALSGAWIGLSFGDDRWGGGYPAFYRRMLRLGHIAFFGLGFVNILFALSILAAPISPMAARAAATAFAVAALTMSPCCFMTAWRRSFRHLFPVPVVSMLAGLTFLLAGWVLR
jgi:hypothetical protein